MHRKPFILALLLALVLTTLPSALAQPGATKIEPRLLDQFAVEGQVDFIVRFVEQADLSPAKSMDWEDAGWFVYDTLEATAARSQAGAIAYLDARGLSHETFVAGNDLYVRGGTQDVALDLAARPEVGYIRALRTYYVDPILSGSAPQAPAALDWGLIDAGADQFWVAFGLQGEGIKVSNIDTGVQWNHPALDQAFACPGDPTNPACWEDPSDICGGIACDNQGHGTHTMGTMVGDDDPNLARQVGMAPKATWIACKGCESDSCSDFALNTCADWILAPGGNADNRPHVVNNSWGGGGGDDWYLAKVQAWVAAGIFPAFAAGNSGSGCSTLGSPGDYQESFGSAAHDSVRSIASFSSRGPSAFGHDPYTKPNISAPGVDICSSVPIDSWDCTYSGTSMASPHTAGAVALLWSCAPSYVRQIDMTMQLLQDTADTPPAGNCGAPPDGEGNYTYGYGYLDVLAAGLRVCAGVPVGWLDGYVRDTNNNPIANATVSAVPGVNGSAITVLTAPSGYYTMTLRTGTYNVTASKAGFTPQTIGGIVIQEGLAVHRNFHLGYLGAWLPSTQPDCFDLTRLDAEFYPATGQVYVLGGRWATDNDGTIYAFDPVANTCTATGQTMPVPICNYTINLVNDGSADLLCTFGGRQADGTATLAVQCYDPVANTVSVVAQLPAAYTGYVPGAQVVVDNMVYILGGLNVNSPPYNLARTDRYDPVTHTFTRLGDLSLARSYIMATAVDGAIYAFGGTVYDGTNLTAQRRTDKMADPGGAGTWDDAAVADMPGPGAEGQALGFQTDSIYGLTHMIVLAPAYAQWPNEAMAVISYDTAADTYSDAFADLNTARRDNAGAFVPLCSSDPADGRPALWVIGGRAGSDIPPYADPEYYPLACLVVGPPDAAFSSDSPVCLGQPMHFADESTAYPPAAAWSWDFGDGMGTAAEQYPVYTYTAAGDYDVTFYVTNSAGMSWTTGMVTVDTPPAASFDYAPAGGLLPLTVYFTNTSPAGIRPTWDFGDGGTGAGDLVSHTYVATGTFVVQLTVRDSCGLDTAAGDVDVEMAPVAGFTADPMAGCGVPLDVRFTDTSRAYPPVDEWWWDLGDGTTSTETNPLHTYDTAGDFVVTLRVTSSLGSDVVTATIAVHELPVAGFDYDPMGGDAPLAVTFTNTSSYGENPVWDLGDGTTAAGDHITHTYDASGIFTVVLTVTSPYGCGEAAASADVTVYGPPAPAFSSDSPVCLGEPMHFTDESTAYPPIDAWFWDFGDMMGTSAGRNPVYTYTAAGDYDVTLWVTSSAGMSWTTGMVTVHPLPVATFTYNPMAGLLPLTVHFTATGSNVLTPTWDLGDGGTAVGWTIQHTYNQTGTFTATMTAGSVGGCGEVTATAGVAVYAPGTCIPVTIVAVNQAPNGCVVDLDATLIGDAPFTYLWNLGAFGTFTTSMVTVDFTVTGTYTGTLDVSNCDGDSHDMAVFSVDVTCEPVYTIYLPVILR